MSLQGQPPLARQRQAELKRLIRSLSKVSEVETRQIRARIQREGQFRNKNRRKRDIQADGLLRQRRMVVLPNLSSSNRLFEGKQKKIESLKERYIDSQAYLKRANFEYKKIDFKKQEVAHKQHKQLNKDRIYASAINLQINPNPQHKLQAEEDPFATPNNHLPEEVNPVLIERLKTTVDSSHKEMKQLYQSHVRQVASLPFRKRIVAYPLKSDEISVLSKESQTSRPQINASKSVILIPSSRRPKKVVDELIRLSSFRSRQNQSTNQPTSKQQQDHLHNTEIMMELHNEIQLDNRLKESIVLGHLKKLLYGDRRGRFILDSTFRTRLRGQHSDQYMNILAEQQNILHDFKGSCLNRRNLVQKFANILGTLRAHSSQEQHEMVLM